MPSLAETMRVCKKDMDNHAKTWQAKHTSANWVPILPSIMSASFSRVDFYTISKQKEIQHRTKSTRNMFEKQNISQNNNIRRREHNKHIMGHLLVQKLFRGMQLIYYTGHYKQYSLYYMCRGTRYIYKITCGCVFCLQCPPLNHANTSWLKW